MNMEKELKEELGLDNNSKIPADFSIPYLVHQDDMNKMDMSHRRIEKWHIVIIILLITLLVSTNIYWIWNESQYEDVVVTQENTDGYNNYVGNNGDITN